MLEEEEEALRNHCRRRTSRVRNEQQHLQQQRGGAPGREGTDGEGQFRDRRKCPLPLPDCAARETARTSHELMCQGPEVQAVPLQLLSLLRLKAVREKMARAAEVELHEPAGCSVCEQEQAALALRSFIRRKKTQLQFQTLKGVCTFGCGGGPVEAPFRRNYSVEMCGSQQPGVALATTKERGVALATDEMRGLP